MGGEEEAGEVGSEEERDDLRVEAVAEAAVERLVDEVLLLCVAAVLLLVVVWLLWLVVAVVSVSVAVAAMMNSLTGLRSRADERTAPLGSGEDERASDTS